MERSFVLRGFAVGALAGLVAFAFAWLFAEPLVQQAIDYEGGRGAAEEALDRAAGIAVPAEGEAPVSRGLQRSAGIATGLVLYGLALGGFFGVAFALSARAFGRVRPFALALAVAGVAFVAFWLVPFLKYPANPPAVGNDATIGSRSLLYAVMVVASVLIAITAVVAGRRLLPRLGAGRAAVAGVALYVVVTGVVMLILPSLGELAANAGAGGSETPAALTDPAGRIVFPGFPADVLAEFRVGAIIEQLLLWGAIGLGFGWLTERAAARRGRAPHEALGAPA